MRRYCYRISRDTIFCIIQGSVLKEALSEKLLGLMESGKLQALKNKWFSATKEKCGMIYSTGNWTVQIQKTYTWIMIEYKWHNKCFLAACLHKKYNNIINYYHNEIIVTSDHIHRLFKFKIAITISRQHLHWGLNILVSQYLLLISWHNLNNEDTVRLW